MVYLISASIQAGSQLWQLSYAGIRNSFKITNNGGTLQSEAPESVFATKPKSQSLRAT